MCGVGTWNLINTFQIYALNKDQRKYRYKFISIDYFAHERKQKDIFSFSHMNIMSKNVFQPIKTLAKIKCVIFNHKKTHSRVMKLLQCFFFSIYL